MAQLVEQTIRNRQVMGSNPIGGLRKSSGFPLKNRLFRKENRYVFKQTARAADSFLVDRQAAGLSPHTLKFYQQFLNPFIAYCNATSLKFIRVITADILGRYSLFFAETHNPGGVHATYRTLRDFFHWPANEEVMAPEWKNPMLKVKAPKVFLDPASINQFYFIPSMQ